MDSELQTMYTQVNSRLLDSPKFRFINYKIPLPYAI